MCHKCNWIEVDGIQAHVNADIKNPETLEALKTLIKLAHNYEKMKQLLSDKESQYNPNGEPAQKE